MMSTLVAVITLPLALSNAPRRMCEVVGGTASEKADLAIVKDARLIVRARAIGRDGVVKGRLSFDVLEVIKAAGPAADSLPRHVSIRGALVDRDDFNKEAPPYRYVRPSGLRGSCFAEEYRAGAEYLLLLDRTPGGELTPYWAPLLPTNEQLHGADDPWLAWIREHAR